jgi:hypothetical protein
VDIKKCILQLQVLGLQAEESKLEPGTIIGGTSSTECASGRVFHEAFFVRPREDGGALIDVAGPGNRATYRAVQHLEDAPAEVLSVYRERCIHIHPKEQK